METLDTAGYEAAVNSAAFMTRTDRAFLRVYGRDPMRIMQGIITNDIANAAPNRVVYAALLTPKGRMVSDLRVVRQGDDLLLDVPATALDALLALFRRTVPPLFARFENVTAAFVMIGVYGPAARAASAHALGAPLPDDLPDLDGYALLDGDVVAFTTHDTQAGDVDLVIPIAKADAVTAALRHAAAKEINADTFHVLRVEAGTPRWGAELDENTIPLEADLQARAIATNKGCYTGQEVIIRILHRGHVNWTLRKLLLGNTPIPSPNTQLTQDGATKLFAKITSATHSPRHNQTIALAYVRREIAAPSTVAVENRQVEVHPLTP